MKWNLDVEGMRFGIDCRQIELAGSFVGEKIAFPGSAPLSLGERGKIMEMRPRRTCQEGSRKNEATDLMTTGFLITFVRDLAAGNKVDAYQSSAGRCEA